MTFEPPCLYCLKGKNEVGFTTIEHIIPESLGNQDYVLPIGFVCDSCNNYFSKTIEKDFLSSVPSLIERIVAGTRSKKGRIPPPERPGIKIEYQESGPAWHIDLNQLPSESYRIDEKIGTRTIFISESSHLQEPYGNNLRFVLKIGLGLLLFIYIKEGYRGNNSPYPYNAIFNSSRSFAREPSRGDMWELWIGNLKQESYPKRGQYNDGMFTLETDGSVIFRYKYGFQAFACNLIKPELSNYQLSIEEDLGLNGSETKVVRI